MLYYVFTVDGDWKEYFDFSLAEESRLPQPEQMRSLIEQEIKTAGRMIDGKFIHFIHNSPRARDLFLSQPFLSQWEKIVAGGGDIGLHCHEDDPHRQYHFDDPGRMKRAIAGQVELLRKKGLDVCSYRGGYMTFSSKLIPVLEEFNICFDFSCEPGRYLVHEGAVVSDWRESPISLYRMDHDDYRKKGNSSLFEVPVGSWQEKYLYFEKADKETLKQVAAALADFSKEKSEDLVVSVLTHSWEFAGDDNLKLLEEKLSTLKQYGQFINLEDLSQIVWEK